MTQADLKYNELIKNIIRNGYSDENSEVRTRWESDNSPAHTLSLFGVQTSFDDNELPILTTKRVAWKTAIKELLLFWVIQTTNKDDFTSANVHVWDQWFNSEGNIGRSYAYQFESHRHHERSIVAVEKKTRKKPECLSQIIVGEPIALNSSCDDELCGETIESQNSGKFLVLDVFSGGAKNNYLKMAKVQFLDTHYCCVITKENAKNGKVKDPYSRRICNIGYEGNVSSVKNYTPNEIASLRSRWTAMIKRCYDSKNNRFNTYGAKGVFVDEKWHSFENYLRDIRRLPQFVLAREAGFKGYHLDKDYYDSNCYSRDTCVWLEVKDNITYSKKPLNLIHPDGTKELFLSISDAEKAHSLNGISCILAKKTGFVKTKGFMAEYLEDDNIYRYELSRNQVTELLNNIQENPQSRRLMTSFWNYADVDKKELQECAWATNFNVRDNKLDLILIQRSVDSALGEPFNWLQYNILQRMIAHVSGLEVGKFIHQAGNVHVYTRHVKKLEQQLTRETFDAPELWINPEVKDFYDFTIEDFELINYKHGEKITFEVAI